MCHRLWHNYNQCGQWLEFRVPPRVNSALEESELHTLHMWRRLSCFPRARSTRKRFGLSSLWKIWICPNFRMGQPTPRSKTMCWSIARLKGIQSCISHRLRGNVGSECWPKLQFAEVRGCQSAAVPAGKGSGNYGGDKAFSNDLAQVLNNRFNVKLTILRPKYTFGGVLFRI